MFEDTLTGCGLMASRSRSNELLPNNRMNLTRSAPQTDRRGPCRLSAC